MALVHYFAAVDRLANPGEGLTYPYLAIPQRDSEFWPEQSARYTAKLVKDKQEDQRLNGLTPVLLLHGALLPLNVLRLIEQWRQMVKTQALPPKFH